MREPDCQRGGVISIVTVAYNAASTIEQAIRSVVDQTCPEIEYIVVDGASTDGTVEILESYEPGIARWVSEPDQGIADAMNKGLGLATGRYVLFLNADDYLVDDRAIERVAPELDTPVVTAPVTKLDPDGRERIVSPRGFTWWMNLKTGLFHQATFCARDLLEDLGGFDTRCRIEMDYDLFLRAYRAGRTVKMLDRPFSVMRSGGVSTRNDASTLNKRMREERAIHWRHCPNLPMRLFYSLYWSVYPRYRLFRGGVDRYRYGG